MEPGAVQQLFVVVMRKQVVHTNTHDLLPRIFDLVAPLVVEFTHDGEQAVQPVVVVLRSDIQLAPAVTGSQFAQVALGAIFSVPCCEQHQLKRSAECAFLTDEIGVFKFLANLGRLLEQPFVKDSSQTVKEMLATGNVDIKSFVRFVLGE